MIRWFRTRRPAPACRVALGFVASLLPGAAVAQSTPAMPRVRSANPMLAQLIADAPAASVTFRGLVACAVRSVVRYCAGTISSHRAVLVLA